MAGLLATYVAAQKPDDKDKSDGDKGGKPSMHGDGCNGVFAKFVNASLRSKGVAKQYYDSFPFPGEKSMSELISEEDGVKMTTTR